jgi:hypothetical protein
VTVVPTTPQSCDVGPPTPFRIQVPGRRCIIPWFAGVHRPNKLTPPQAAATLRCAVPSLRGGGNALIVAYQYTTTEGCGAAARYASAPAHLLIHDGIAGAGGTHAHAYASAERCCVFGSNGCTHIKSQ